MTSLPSVRRPYRGSLHPSVPCCSRTAKCGCTTNCWPSDVPEDPLVARMLPDYFPLRCRLVTANRCSGHPLRREILATHLTKRAHQPGWLHLCVPADGGNRCASSDIVRACIMARDVFDLDDVWSRIDALDNCVADEVQASMFVSVVRLLEEATLWFLASSDAVDYGPPLRAWPQRSGSRVVMRRYKGSHLSCRCCCPPTNSTCCPNDSARWRRQASKAALRRR